METSIEYASENGIDVVDVERKKSVSFNQMVQKISILDEKRESVQTDENPANNK